MDRIIHLRSDLDGFILLDAIGGIGPGSITGFRQFDRAPLYLGIEALAQLGAFHARFLVDFEKHAFLLGVKRCSLPPVPELTGSFRLTGELSSRSSSAFSHRLVAANEDGTALEGEFLFAVTPYDGSDFNRDILRAHYRKVFSCLRSGSKKNC